MEVFLVQFPDIAKITDAFESQKLAHEEIFLVA